MTPGVISKGKLFPLIVAGITCGGFAPAWADFKDALVPIQESTTNDPAGTQLMIVSIGLMGTVVLTLFTVTIIFITKGKKKPHAPKNDRSERS